MAWKYRIRPEQCRACGACAKACAADAIVLRDRMIPDAELHPSFAKTYAIDEARCTRCGACLPACKLRVIVKKFSLR